MTERTEAQPPPPAESPQDHHELTVAAVSHDDGLRVELGNTYLTAAQARRLAVRLLEAADKIDG